MSEQQNRMWSDPHVLVAMNSVGVGHSIVIGDADRKYSIAGPLQPSYDVENDAAPRRSFPVLDALASLSVSEGASQVAIALQMDNERKQIRLTIAENSDVHPKVIEHIQRLWELLRTLSGHYTNPPADGWTRGVSPLLPDTLVKHPVRHEIIRRVYEFSAAKNKRRFTKWWADLVEFARRFQRNMDDLAGAEIQKKEFLDIMYSLVYIEATLQHAPGGSIIGDDSWDDFVVMMSGATGAVDRLLQDDLICEIWAKSLAGALSHPHVYLQILTLSSVTDTPFRLRSALEALTTQHRQINILVSFALSRRLRQAFEYDMSIHPVPRHPRVQISLPASAHGWKSVINNLCQGNAPATSQWLEMEANRLAKQFPPKHPAANGTSIPPHNSRFGVVHCECALISFLDTHTPTTWSSIPPFNYIGVSKLPCRPCHIWIKTFNTLGGRKYFTRGSRPKWHFPWAMPERSSGPHRDAVAGVVGREYVKFKLSKGDLHSDALYTGAKVTMGREEKAVWKEMLEERRRRRGLSLSG